MNQKTKQLFGSAFERELDKHIKATMEKDLWPYARVHLAILAAAVIDHLALRRAPKRGALIWAWTHYIAGKNRKIAADQWLQSDECKEIVSKLGLSYSYVLVLIAKVKARSLLHFPEYTKAELEEQEVWRREALAISAQKRSAA